MRLHETINGIRNMLAHKQEDLLDYSTLTDCVNHIFTNWTNLRKRIELSLHFLTIIVPLIAHLFPVNHPISEAYLKKWEGKFIRTCCALILASQVINLVNECTSIRALGKKWLSHFNTQNIIDALSILISFAYCILKIA